MKALTVRFELSSGDQVPAVSDMLKAVRLLSDCSFGYTVDEFDETEKASPVKVVHKYYLRVHGQDILIQGDPREYDQGYLQCMADRYFVEGCGCKCTSAFDDDGEGDPGYCVDLSGCQLHEASPARGDSASVHSHTLVEMLKCRLTDCQSTIRQSPGMHAAVTSRLRKAAIDDCLHLIEEADVQPLSAQEYPLVCKLIAGLEDTDQTHYHGGAYVPQFAATVKELKALLRMQPSAAPAPVEYRTAYDRIQSSLSDLAVEIDRGVQHHSMDCEWMQREVTRVLGDLATLQPSAAPDNKAVADVNRAYCALRSGYLWDKDPAQVKRWEAMTLAMTCLMQSQRDTATAPAAPDFQPSAGLIDDLVKAWKQLYRAIATGEGSISFGNEAVEKAVKALVDSTSTPAAAAAHSIQEDLMVNTIAQNQYGKLADLVDKTLSYLGDNLNTDWSPGHQLKAYLQDMRDLLETPAASVCTRDHQCAVDGPCNGYPRTGFGTCQWCNKTVALNAKGALVYHGDDCPGDGLPAGKPAASEGFTRDDIQWLLDYVGSCSYARAVPIHKKLVAMLDSFGKQPVRFEPLAPASGAAKSRLVMDLDEPLTQQEQEDLRFLVSDAIHEWRNARQGDYVERRYAHMSEDWRRSKAAQVTRRIALSKKVGASAYDLRVEGPEEKSC